MEFEVNFENRTLLNTLNRRISMKTIQKSVVLLSCLGILFCSTAAQADLLSSWDFNEGSGDTVADSSGNGNNGTITNTAAGGLGDNGSVWVNDPERGSVISFGGGADDAYVSLGELIPVMTIDQDFTWAFWGQRSIG
jgi:hypothetical protein